jgi:shikimate kinase
LDSFNLEKMSTGNFSTAWKISKMKMYLVGVSCIGKTTIGKRLAENLSCQFFDFDVEVEKYFAMPISKIKARFLTAYSFRKEATAVLKRIIEQNNDGDYVVAMPPSGLMDSYWKVLKKLDCIIIVLKDSPENILQRIVFYDADSKPIQNQLTAKEKAYYLSDIKGDIKYFGKPYARAHLTVDIEGHGVDGAVGRIVETLRDDGWVKREN